MTETRQRLLEAARHCLADKGLAQTTSRHIAGAAGANLASITYHFGSKDELVAAALLEGLQEWLAPTIDVLAGDGDPVARTTVAIQTLIATFDQRRADAPAYLEALLQAPRMEPLRRALLSLWSDLRRLLADQMEQMQRDGLLPQWVQPEAMASLFIAVANGLAVQVTIDDDGPGLTQMAGQFGGLLLAARP